MANPVCELLLTKAELERTVDWPPLCAGAIVDFRGVVREEEQERSIRGIHYEAHGAMARHQLELIAREATERFGLQMALIRHRTGFVPVGEASLFARVAAPHRREAIEAMEWMVDQLKKKVPIWKHPEFELDQPLKTPAREPQPEILRT
jgi:molybdopterin synthase catalytic subunit